MSTTDFTDRNKSGTGEYRGTGARAGEALGDAGRRTGSSTTGGFADQGKSYADQTRDQSGERPGSFSESATGMADQARGLAEDAYETGRDAARSIKGQIESQPLAALLIGVAAGYLLSYLIHGRRSAAF